MATLRELKGRIGSVASSEKITGAMKMISSAKMHKAELGLKRLVPFRSQIETIIANLLSADSAFSSPLIQPREVKSVTVAVWGSDDGLCGAYNVNIAKQLKTHTDALTAKYGSQTRIRVIAVGKKMYKACAKIAKANISVEQAAAVDSKSGGQPVNDFTAMLEQAFLSGQTDQVDLLYMYFKSAGKQTPRIDTLLPISQDAFASDEKKASGRPYIFEPDANTIFNNVLPLFIQSVMQEVFVENQASEQAARVMAMQSANDNAKKLLDQLRLEYNKLRQQAITNELLDILGGQTR